MSTNIGKIKGLNVGQKILRRETQILSPLAKYDSKGNLICIICNSIIKSSSLWKVHINSKLHRVNVEKTKKINKQILQTTVKSKVEVVNVPQTVPHPEKKNITHHKFPTCDNNEVTTSDQKACPSVLQEPSEVLPEMFFDDPAADAKIRNVAFKNVQVDEWERFQREINEETMSSNKVLFSEQINSALDREITEVSEQIYQWSKVINLENKLHSISKKGRSTEIDETDENSSEDEINDYIDWRTKKFV